MNALPRPPEEVLAGLPPAVVAYLQALEALVVAHEARIVALEARLRQDSSTSSRPPWSDPPATQAQRRAPPRRRAGRPVRSGAGGVGSPGIQATIGCCSGRSGSTGWGWRPQTPVGGAGG